MRRLLVIRGIPGSGKTTLATRMSESGEFAGASLYAADDYFHGPDGTYAFDPSLLGLAHGHCVRNVVEHLRCNHALRPDEARAIIVHNTGLTVAEVAPYVAIGEAFEHRVDVLTLVCPVELATRNVHGVSEWALRRMAARLDMSLPSRWNHTVRPAEA